LLDLADLETRSASISQAYIGDLLPKSRHGAPVETENADTEYLAGKVCESTSPTAPL
jgi:hypothetical protein